jgi:hypothetical protein
MVQMAFAQHHLLFESKIYFEDAIGNKDTIEIAYDTTANSIYNPLLGEVDLDAPFNKVFEVRASHGLDWQRNSSECRLSRRIVGSCEKLIDILDPSNACYAGESILFFIKALHQPVKITWDRNAFEDNIKSCQGASFFITDYSYHISDPLSWIWFAKKRFACAGREDQFIVNLDKEYTDTAYSNEVTFSTTRAFSNGLTETISAVELNFENSDDFSPCQLISKTEYANHVAESNQFEKPYPNPAVNSIFIENPSINPVLSVTIFDQTGQFIKSCEWSDQFEKTHQIRVDDLNAGIYFIQYSHRNKEMHYGRFVK